MSKIWGVDNTICLGGGTLERKLLFPHLPPSISSSAWSVQPLQCPIRVRHICFTSQKLHSLSSLFQRVPWMPVSVQRSAHLLLISCKRKRSINSVIRFWCRVSDFLALQTGTLLNQRLRHHQLFTDADEGGTQKSNSNLNSATPALRRFPVVENSK
jgi:hypothetical protein